MSQCWDNPCRRLLLGRCWEEFANALLATWGFKVPAASKCLVKATELNAIKKTSPGPSISQDMELHECEMPAILPEDPRLLPTERQFEFVTDNEHLSKLLTGAAVPEAPHRADIESCIEMIRACVDIGWRPRHLVCEPVVWRPREHNTLADAVANFCMDSQSDFL